MTLNDHEPTLTTIQTGITGTAARDLRKCQRRVDSPVLQPGRTKSPVSLTTLPMSDAGDLGTVAHALNGRHHLTLTANREFLVIKAGWTALPAVENY